MLFLNYVSHSFLVIQSDIWKGPNSTHTQRARELSRRMHRQLLRAVVQHDRTRAIGTTYRCISGNLTRLVVEIERERGMLLVKGCHQERLINGEGDLRFVSVIISLFSPSMCVCINVLRLSLSTVSSLTSSACLRSLRPVVSWNETTTTATTDTRRAMHAQARGGGDRHG